MCTAIFVRLLLSMPVLSGWESVGAFSGLPLYKAVGAWPTVTEAPVISSLSESIQVLGCKYCLNTRLCSKLLVFEATAVCEAILIVKDHKCSRCRGLGQLSGVRGQGSHQTPEHRQTQPPLGSGSDEPLPSQPSQPGASEMQERRQRQPGLS